MAILPDFLRIEHDGVEFFTLTATGESGMSQRGLARACGVTNPAILKLVSTLITKAPSKWLQSFVGQGLTLITNATKNNKEVTVYKAEFCAASIKHYAYKGKEVAQDFDGALGSIGLTSYIQGVTGWLPNQFQSSPAARQKLSHILDAPTPWVKLYEREFCTKVYTWFGPNFYWEIWVKAPSFKTALILALAT